ncbi:MAG: hypothetical protein AAGE52_30895, partial [Myxococcota bacterium]
MRSAFRFGLYALVHGAAVIAYLASGEYALGVFPLDDAYIHQVYAEGIAYGDGFAYNPGVPAAGITSPLWAVLLAPFHGAGGMSVFGTKILGSLLVVLSAWLADRWMQTTSAPSFGRLAGTLIALDPPLVFAGLSGMEVPLAVALILGTLLALHHDRIRIAGVLLAAAVLTRPELALLWLVLAVHHRTHDKRAWIWAPPAIALVLWSGWCLHAANTLLPTTFYAKHGAQGPVAQWMDAPRVLLSLGGGPVLSLVGFPLALLGAWRWKRLDVSGALPIGLAVLTLGLVWAHDVREIDFYWSRYALVARPLLLLLVVAAVASLPKRLLPVAALALLVSLGIAHATAANEYAENCRNIAELNLAAAAWIRSHSEEADWIASGDAGAMRAVGGRRVVDLVGLNDHRMLGAGRTDV